MSQSVFSSNLWLNSECGNQPGIDMSLIMCDCFFVIFKQTIRMDVLISMSEYLLLSSLLYNRCCCGFKPLLLMCFVDIPYSGLLTLLNFLFSRRHFLLFLFFFGINMYGPTLLCFLVGRARPWLKSLCLADWYLNQLGWDVDNMGDWYGNGYHTLNPSTSDCCLYLDKDCEHMATIFVDEEMEF